MISLAGRDILHGWGKFVLTGVGLGLLIGVTLSMAGVYRGMIDDAQALLDNSGADLWVVQKDTLGPYAEPSSLNEDTERPAMACSASVSSLPNRICGSRLAAAAWNAGAIWRHGPHHCAQKSTRSGISLLVA